MYILRISYFAFFPPKYSPFSSSKTGPGCGNTNRGVWGKRRRCVPWWWSRFVFSYLQCHRRLVIKRKGSSNRSPNTSLSCISRFLKAMENPISHCGFKWTGRKEIFFIHHWLKYKEKEVLNIIFHAMQVVEHSKG